MRRGSAVALVTLLAIAGVGGHAVPAAEASGAAASEADLARTVQNPLANLVTLPFQANFNNGIEPYDRTLFNLNVQPVIPYPGEEWNVIARAIIPINSVPIGETDSTFGIGDTSLTLLWTPSDATRLVWGVGPAITLPTASNPEVLGSDKLSLGPSAVIFYSVGHWTLGGIAQNVWSVAGDDDRKDVSFFYAQYFANYNLGRGWAVGTAPIVTADWKADSGEQWTVPWGLQVAKVTRFGARPVNLLAGYYRNSEHPTGSADSQVRLQLNFLFPQRKP